MLFEEARWLGRQLSRLDPNYLYPLCNIGSSTEQYRSVDQPYVDRFLFAPARMRSQKVLHVDVKSEVGIDLVGDLDDQEFVAQLAQLEIRSVMCCNLLEHVRNREVICKSILSLVKAGGYIVVSVPNHFPYHPDPIDTMYRPSIVQLAQLFPGSSTHKARIIRASRVRHEMGGNYRMVVRLIAGSLFPVYRPWHWKWRVQRVYEIARGFGVTCLILRKEREVGHSPAPSAISASHHGASVAS
jgi:hypothetical protein